MSNHHFSGDAIVNFPAISLSLQGNSLRPNQPIKMIASCVRRKLKVAIEITNDETQTFLIESIKTTSFICRGKTYRKWRGKQSALSNYWMSFILINYFFFFRGMLIKMFSSWAMLGTCRNGSWRGKINNREASVAGARTRTRRRRRTWAIYLIKQVVPLITLADAARCCLLLLCPFCRLPFPSHKLVLIKISFTNFSIYLA